MNKLQSFVFHFKKGLKSIPFAQLDVAKIKHFAQQSTVTGQSVTYDEATGKVTVNIGGEEHTEQLMELASDGALVNFAPDQPFAAAPATETEPATTEATADVAESESAQTTETKVADTIAGETSATTTNEAGDANAKTAVDGTADTGADKTEATADTTKNKTTEAAAKETAPATANEGATATTTPETSDFTKGGKVEGGKDEGAE